MMVLNDLIKDAKYMKIGQKTTICLITLDNGYEVVGSSACLDLSSYNFEIGKEFAREDAIKKLNTINGFLLTEHMHLAKTKMMEGVGYESL